MSPNDQRKELARREGVELETVRIDDPILAMISRAAENPATDISKLKELLALEREVRQERAAGSFAEDMRKAPSEMAPVVRDAENTHTKSKYARLETIDAEIRPIYTRHGFSLTFNSVPAASGLTITCEVLHSSGHCKRYELSGALDTAGAKGTDNKTSIQGLGSTASYLRRYLTCLIFNITLKNEDRDGNAMGFITEQQVNTILDMFTACDMDLASQSKFLDFVNAETVNEIPRRNYEKGMVALRTKLRKLRESQQ